MGRDYKRYKKTLGSDNYVHCLNCGASCLDEYAQVKTHQLVHFKYVQFIICQLYFNKALKSKKKERSQIIVMHDFELDAGPENKVGVKGITRTIGAIVNYITLV